MKLIGSVNGVDRKVAKRDKDGSFDEKRHFLISARPATALGSSYYGYGGMNFALNGRELQDFGCDLGDEVEIYVVRKGEDYANRQIEDVSRALYEAENKVADLETKLEAVRGRASSAELHQRDNTIRMQALQTENVRLMTELETLRAVRADLGAMVNLKQIGRTGEVE